MKFVDVVSLTQNAVAQTLGESYLTANDGTIKAIDSFNLVDVGTDILSSGSADSYVKALLTQMGKMVIDAKRYTSEIPSIFVDSFEWGGFIQQVMFLPQDILQDDMYNLVNGQVYEDHKFYEPNVKAKIFQEAKKVVVPISITDDAMKMAFTGWEQMNSFLSGIHTNVDNTITLALEAYAHMLVSCAVATSIKKTTTSVHLGTEFYGTETLETKTYKQMLDDKEFLVYALKRISKVKDDMKRMTTNFNNGTVPVFTDSSDAKCCLLADFARACKFDVNANTYNKEDIAIGDFDKITAWQAFKATDQPNFDVETSSKIMIGADPTNKLGLGTTAFTQGGVIGIVYDRRGIGLCPYKTKVTSNYTASADFWNEYHHQLVNYLLNDNYNMVAFTLD